MTPGKRVAIALGSGGARGYAHIGALEVIAERGHEVVTIAGTSMGALVGSFAASGRMDNLKEWALSLTQRDILRLVDPSLGGPGVVRAERILTKIGALLADSQIEDFPIPFTAVATDLDGRREVWFQKGPADIAVRASIAMPGVIHPITVDGRMLVDGGLMKAQCRAAAGTDRLQSVCSEVDRLSEAQRKLDEFRSRYVTDCE